MTRKNRLALISTLITLGLFLLYVNQPTVIIDVHNDKNTKGYYLIVRNFPLTDLGKIYWWEKNKFKLARKYNIPVDKPEFTISFWVGDYKKDSGTDHDSDLLCFSDMESEQNCIEKGNQPLTIWYIEHSNQTVYLLNEWKNKYVRDNNTGVLEKIR